MRRLPVLLAALVTVLTLVVSGAPAEAAGKPWVEQAQRRLNHLHCHAGPADGNLGRWTRSAVIRFQSRHALEQNGRLTSRVRRQLYADDAQRCDVRPLPRHSGTGRRIVISQHQNWVWLVGPAGGVVAEGGMVDNSSQLRRGGYATGSYCGRAARIGRNAATSSNQVWLDNFVRFAPCGFGFHRIPTWRSTGRQVHPDWFLGTDFADSHGCIRLSRELSRSVWRFTTRRTPVRVV